MKVRMGNDGKLNPMSEEQGSDIGQHMTRISMPELEENHMILRPSKSHAEQHTTSDSSMFLKVRMLM